MWYCGGQAAARLAPDLTMAKARSLAEFRHSFPDEAHCAVFLVPKRPSGERRVTEKRRREWGATAQPKRKIC